MADVDFGGSTGYGREYRYALEHQWGVVDVEDAASAAAFLAEQGLADPKKLAIDGGSAGGFTTLAALTFTDTFTAGCCCYGISDLEILAADTHKVSTCGRTGRGRGLTEMNSSSRGTWISASDRTRKRETDTRPGPPSTTSTR